MKKGCFFGTIIFLTIAIGIISYLYKKYYPEIKSFGKEKIMQAGLKEINEKIDGLNKSVYNDSLKALLVNQSELLKKKDFENSMNSFGSLMEQVKFFINDKMIDSVEYSILKNMAIKNERSAKN